MKNIPLRCVLYEQGQSESGGKITAPNSKPLQLQNRSFLVKLLRQSHHFGSHCVLADNC